MNTFFLSISYFYTNFRFQDFLYQEPICYFVNSKNFSKILPNSKNLKKNYWVFKRKNRIVIPKNKFLKKNFFPGFF